MRATPEAFLAARDVSRETLGRLTTYAALLEKWNPAINLVARSTLGDLWSRHFLDSTQVFDLRPAETGRWVDLGSGGGFPGLVLAILAADEAPDLRVILVESDQRKATFLRTAARETGVTVEVHASRIEDLAPLDADVVSARALAPLSPLLGLATPHLKAGGRGLFPKGATHDREIAEALASWSFEVQKYPSRTDPDSVILSIGDLHHV
ncbi:16S rRNA (guanine(527)-N(7))-methyltransferase RsmG [Acidimangrovimonas sediminis]|uniref:16S rRNA (guanine(527)-N(7))-methyltransferase RsmG n=1 Tax=Acidimangrovimonas sediminis TaxID=2056283 RepID=UPI000C8001F8|nr:16S rRNA (guanine(527)-N(7))-methyltransferase RsmG [Acidimangrovimonas sediminis]